MAVFIIKPRKKKKQVSPSLAAGIVGSGVVVGGLVGAGVGMGTAQTDTHIHVKTCNHEQIHRDPWN